MNQLDQDCLETIFRFCHSDELISLCAVHPKILQVIERLESIHLEHLVREEDREIESEHENNHDPSLRNKQPTAIMGTSHGGGATIISPFLKPSHHKECAETKYRLQIYHPSYTVHVIHDSGRGGTSLISELGKYLVEELNFKLIEDNHDLTVLEIEILKSSFVKSLRDRLKGKVEKILDSGKSVNNGITNIIDTEFKPYSTKNQQCLINFYERFTLRLVLKKKNIISNHFVLASGQVFCLHENTGKEPGLNLYMNDDYSDRIIGIKSMLDFYGKKPEIISDLMICMILQHTMPKYYFENYRVSEDLEPSKYLALVDVFYYEMLSSDSRMSTIPVFLTQNYFNTPFELFKHALEMCFDILYNQISTRKKIELIEKLSTTYLNQEMTSEHVHIIRSESSLKYSDIQDNKYISGNVGTQILTFIIVCIETVTTVVVTKSDERIKTVTTNLKEYTLQLPNLINGNTVERIRISSRTLDGSKPPTLTNDNQQLNVVPSKGLCILF